MGILKAKVGVWVPVAFLFGVIVRQSETEVACVKILWAVQPCCELEELCFATQIMSSRIQLLVSCLTKHRSGFFLCFLISYGMQNGGVFLFKKKSDQES